MTKYGMNGKKDSQLVDTNYIKDGTESGTLDDPRLEKLWSKVSKVSRNWRVFLLSITMCVFWELPDLNIFSTLLLSTGQAVVLCSLHLCSQGMPSASRSPGMAGSL